MSILTDVDPGLRKNIYRGFGVVGLSLGATQVGYSAAEAGQPVWLTVALAVFGFVAGAVGYTAQSNTDVPDYEWSGADVDPGVDDVPPGYENDNDPEDDDNVR